ncbi:MAG TPA: hypothetical protein VLF89_08045 [Candidatus Saccharimonadales bacterium]|nr:hypothetical protein [Candidatus Saccharimonadales bacterium]
MNIAEILSQVYNTGMLAFAIMMLAIAIIIYPTLRRHSRNNKHK